MLITTAAPRVARACGPEYDDGIEESTTFDPKVLEIVGEEGFFYDSTTPGVGNGNAPCSDCSDDPMETDWQAFFGKRVPWKDWSPILLKAQLPEIDSLIFALQGKAAPPKGFEKNALLAAGADRAKAIAALYFAGFARRVEPWAAPPPAWGEPAPRPPAEEGAALEAGGEKAFARAKQPFLQQRYAFQLLRLRFYRRDFDGVIAFHHQQRRALERPSSDLKWRARYYLAGALMRSGQRSAANLELARIHAHAPALAWGAAQDFQPMEDNDWKATLAAAASVAERIDLWRLVGLKFDPLVAIQHIITLDPRSDRAAILAVREINRAESRGADADLDALGALARKLGDDRRTSRSWLFDLVAAHVAALRGDVAAVRVRLARVLAARRGDALIESQAHATLAIGLARSWKEPDPALEDELARELELLPNDYSRGPAVRDGVTQALASGYEKRGLCLEASLLHSTSCAAKWSDPAFVRAVIARVVKPAGAYDRLLVATSGYDAAQLEAGLGLLHFERSEFADARRIFEGSRAGGFALEADPFVIHIRDCHSCDREQSARKPRWTLGSFILRMIELHAQAARPGEQGAAAAMLLGNGYYNITPIGNSALYLVGNEAPADVKRAEGFYRRAFEKSRDRELKAKAAFLASKAELARRIASNASGPVDPKDQLPIPAAWFAVVKSLRDTAYYREILRECGHYRRWATTAR